MSLRHNAEGGVALPDKTIFKKTVFIKSPFNITLFLRNITLLMTLNVTSLEKARRNPDVLTNVTENVGTL